MKKSGLSLSIRRVLFVVCPLFSIACYSAPEWPARVAMMDGNVRDVFYEPAVKWQNAVANATNFIKPMKQEESSMEDVAIAQNSEIESNDEKNTMIEVTNPQKLVLSSEKDSAVEVATAPAEDQKVSPVINDVAQNVQEKLPEVKKVESKNVAVGSILTVGDSLMSEVAAGLRYGLSKDVRLKDIHKSSTGLTNADYYDWPSVAAAAAKKYPSDLIIIHMGGNDGQDMKIGKRFVHVGDSDWQNTYYLRAMLLIKEIKKASPQSHIVWLGLPAMRDAKFAKKQDIIRNLQMKAALDSDIEYIDGKKGLGETYSKEGTYEGKRVVLRRTDGIHYSREGGEILARLIASDEKLGLKWK